MTVFYLPKIPGREDWIISDNNEETKRGISKNIHSLLRKISKIYYPFYQDSFMKCSAIIAANRN